MQRIHHLWSVGRNSLLPATAVILTIAIFILDTVTDLEIAVCDRDPAFGSLLPKARCVAVRRNVRCADGG